MPPFLLASTGCASPFGFHRLCLCDFCCLSFRLHCLPYSCHLALFNFSVWPGCRFLQLHFLCLRLSPSFPAAASLLPCGFYRLSLWPRCLNLRLSLPLARTIALSLPFLTASLPSILASSRSLRQPVLQQLYYSTNGSASSRRQTFHRVKSGQITSLTEYFPAAATLLPCGFYRLSLRPGCLNLQRSLPHACLSLCVKAPTWPVCDNRQNNNNNAPLSLAGDLVRDAVLHPLLRDVSRGVRALPTTAFTAFPSVFPLSSYCSASPSTLPMSGGLRAVPLLPLFFRTSE